MSDLNALDLEPGEIVGGYTLISRLGGGAMGSVWRVRDDGGQDYAMKILRDSLKDDSDTSNQDYQNNGSADSNTSDSYGNTIDDGNNNTAQQHHHHSHDPHVTARERMRREAVAMRKINHPGVCAIVDMELDDSLAFIVTELIEGKNLRDDVAANGRYVGDDLQRLAAKLIDAVRAVHAQGIIHRDIKPTNVMISAAGPVLVDFGIAMSAGESHVTRTGLVMGTPGFIAPEIIDGAESNEATDWWSLASVIAFAATGRPVFGSKPMMAVLEREASGNANLAGLPPNTLNALRSALDPDPTKRCSPDQLLQAITLDALNPFENGELDDDDDATGNGAEGVVPPFGQTPRPDSASPNSATDNPRAAWIDSTPIASPSSQTDSLALSGSSRMQPATSQGRQIRGSTRAMPRTQAMANPQTQPAQKAGYSRNQPLQTRSTQGSNPAPDEDATETLPAPSPQDLTATSAMAQGDSSANAAATMPLGTPMTQSLEQTSTLPASNPHAAQQAEDATMPLAVAPTPYIYGQPNNQPNNQPNGQPAPGYVPGQAAAGAQPMLQSPEPLENPANIRRGKLISRSILPLWLLAIPLALLSASAPIISICCATALLWFLLALGYSEEGQLEREGRRGGIRKGGDFALRTVSLPWHILKALIFTIPRALILIVIAGVGPVVVNLVSGLPTHMVALTIASWHLPLPLPADVSISYSSASLAVFMAAAWLVIVFGPKNTLLRIGAGRLRGAAYPKPDSATQTQPRPLAQSPAENEYDNEPDDENDTYDIVDGIDEIEGDGTPKRHSARRWVLLAIWAVATLVALAYVLINHQIDWVPLPNPQL
ncbi:serine/threonine protein kinase [Bifidobacterium sp. ESL0732]|uniref:serine/threonine-protein kinase n=1 Tax=Bifidobacterium sp. ESL0732 TaxID=2983222 RepID=UPI0023F6DABA|nr:serine/threonine protein kinase [Bifidobacterium sp. ESL0732]WEV64086.1 protein kinase [Bifidobacterium sp. ESL0732]